MMLFGSAQTYLKLKVSHLPIVLVMNIRKSFDAVYADYGSEWNDWIASDYCFLSDIEICSVEAYLLSPTVIHVAMKLKRSNLTAGKILRRSINKMRNKKSIFLDWRVTRKEDVEYPLNVPIPCLKISIGLQRILNSVADTLKEFLESTSLQDLSNHRGIGSGRINELIDFLGKYGMLNRLNGFVSIRSPEHVVKKRSIQTKLSCINESDFFTPCQLLLQASLAINNSRVTYESY